MSKRFLLISNTSVLALGLLTLPLGNATADSLWKDSGRISFKADYSIASDKKAHSVGDILTIIIQENNGATRQNNTTTAKKTSVNAALASLFYAPSVSGLLTKKGTLPTMAYTSDSEFNGGGSINNAETITAQMAVRVVDVLPNGNMVIEGTLRTSFSGEKQDAVVRGTVRPDDITSNNTLLSYNIADATIQFISKGVISDSQRKGWFTRVWEKVNPL
jgi:flagellar L-ring protein precursor FlgH